MKQRNENGMVYRGACDLVHIADGERAEVGEALAGELDAMMRRDAVENGSRTYAQVYGEPGKRAQPLCAGCYMVAIFNAAVTLAKENGQSLTELGNSLSKAFASLAEGGADRIESIHVALDPPESDSIIAAGHALEAAAFDSLLANWAKPDTAADEAEAVASLKHYAFDALVGVEDVTLWGTLAGYAAQGGMVL